MLSGKSKVQDNECKYKSSINQYTQVGEEDQYTGNIPGNGFTGCLGRPGCGAGPREPSHGICFRVLDHANILLIKHENKN